MKEHSVSITPKTILFTIAALVGIFLLFLLQEIVVALFLALIIMSALNPAVTWLETRKIPRVIGISLMYLIVLSILGIMIAFVVPPLTGELANLIKTLQIPQFPAEIWDVRLDLQAMSSVFSQLGSSVVSVVSIVTSTFSSLLFVVTTLVLGFYLLLDRKNLPNKLTWISDNKNHHKLIAEFLDRMELDLGGWVRGQLILMFAIGNITYIALTLLGIPYALPLAFLAGMLEILPNLGPTIAAIPAILVALLLVNPTMAIVMVVLYLAIQQFENSFLVPNIMRASLDIDAITTILAILIGLKLGGVSGALLSVPTFALLRIAFRMWKRENKVTAIL